MPAQRRPWYNDPSGSSSAFFGTSAMADNQQKPLLIYVSGNNASGKTTVARALASRLGLSHLPAQSSDASYLPDLFSRPKRWSFEAQAHFLAFKVGLVRHCADTMTNAVIDRSPYEDAEVFARYFREAKRLDSRAYQTYRQLYRTLVDGLPAPDLIIYCQCSLPELQRRIASRSRDYELLYPADHMPLLSALYADWLRRACTVFSGTVFSVDTEAHDFISDDTLLDSLASDVLYLLHHHRLQLELFSEPEPPPSMFGAAPVFRGTLRRLRSQDVFIPKAPLRRPTAYLAAPFTGKATEALPASPPVHDHSSQQFLGDWVLNSAPHGKIQDTAYRAYLESIETLIRGCGYKTFLPHRDINRWGDRQLTPEQGASECTRRVFDSDVLVALPQTSLGTHYEVGLALGYGLPVIVLVPDADATSFIMQGLGSLPTVLVVTFSSLPELKDRLAAMLNDLAGRLAG